MVDSADFDGTNDYMTRGAALTGAVDSKLGLISLWFRLDGGDASTMRLCYGASTVGGNTARNITVIRQISNFIRIQGFNAAGGSILAIDNTNALTAGATWRHLLASWDMADTAKRHLYVDDVSDLNPIVYTNDTVNYASADFGIAARPDGVQKFNGCLAEVYMNFGVYLDLSVESNRRKFRTAAGLAADLGADGSTPTGSAPTIYLHLATGEAVANFATNRGTGGDFSISGTLETGSSAPEAESGDTGAPASVRRRYRW